MTPTLFLAGLMATASTADAAGYYMSDVGTRGMSRAGAFIAGVDDLSAQYYNPAALIGSGGHGCISATAVRQPIEFLQGHDESAPSRRPGSRDQRGKPMHIPNFG